VKIGLPMAVLVAVIAWIVLYVIIGIPLWIAFVVAGGLIALGVAAGGVEKVT
jgi:phosphate/sulfate permease